MVVTYFNKRMFDEAGVAYPTDDWTYDDMLAAAEKLTIKAPDGTTTQELHLDGDRAQIRAAACEEAAVALVRALGVGVTDDHGGGEGR